MPRQTRGSCSTTPDLTDLLVRSQNPPDSRPMCGKSPVACAASALRAGSRGARKFNSIGRPVIDAARIAAVPGSTSARMWQRANWVPMTL